MPRARIATISFLFRVILILLITPTSNMRNTWRIIPKTSSIHNASSAAVPLERYCRKVPELMDIGHFLLNPVTQVHHGPQVTKMMERKTSNSTRVTFAL